MEVYVARVMYNDYDENWSDIGVYSSKEKAENAILDFLRGEGEPAINLEIYDYESSYRERILYEIEKFELDK